MIVSDEFFANNLAKDKFGIPILPADTISEDSNGNLNAKIHLFTDITADKEKYIEIEFKSIDQNNILPDFYYIKPDPGELDPRKIENIKFIDESKTTKPRSGYILIAKIPTDIDVHNDKKTKLKLYGMRNHLHRPITYEDPGLICAVCDLQSQTWSIRNYFEESQIKFVKN